VHVQSVLLAMQIQNRGDRQGAEQGGHPKGDAKLVDDVGGHGAEHCDHHHRRPMGKSSRRVG
jgi:hypothetical protein